jgi:hypothetical protein
MDTKRPPDESSFQEGAESEQGSPEEDDGASKVPADREASWKDGVRRRAEETLKRLRKGR